MADCSNSMSIWRYGVFYFALTLMLPLVAFSSGLRHWDESESDKSIGNKASIGRSDTVDVIHTTINLDMTDFSGKTIKGNCVIQLVPLKNNVSVLYFDLLELKVDSVLINGIKQAFSYNDTLIRIGISPAIGIVDTTEVSVFYGGSPVKDNSWGGFYFQNNYAFNLGVAFTSNPHNYGRVWFPCFDNFVERSTYSFNILTSDGKKSHCNGMLKSETVVGMDSVLRSWETTDAVPSYLVGIAVSDYETLKWQHQGQNKTIPVEVAAREGDTANARKSFLHLNDAIDTYEAAYGPYLFQKVGYSLVPFNAGAMEHATNIAYPRYAADGSLSYENLMAHELSHHWWGNLVTCRTDADMWLNEGMASYCEHLFQEYVYGKDAFIRDVQLNLTNVLQYAHIREQSYRAVTNLPHNLTYGMHTYDKGALVAHNLRGYLGDSLYFAGSADFLNTNKYKDVSSLDLKNHMEGFSGKNLNSFFDEWVFGAGFPHFSIDSFTVEPLSGVYRLRLFIRQKMKGTLAAFNDVPLSFDCYDRALNKYSYNGMVSGLTDILEFSVPVIPEYVLINPENQLNLAMTQDVQFISESGQVNYRFGKMNVEVEEVSDTTLLVIRHNWVSPDPVKATNQNFRISDYRFWTVEGIISDDFKANATLFFDGRNIQSGGDGNLDFDLLRSGEDSLLLLFREDPSNDWREFRTYTVNNLNSISDRYGSISITGLVPGEYALAKGQTAVGRSVQEQDKIQVYLYPNPQGSNSYLTFSGMEPVDIESIRIISMNGQEIKNMTSIQNSRISTKGLSAGTYEFIFNTKSGIYRSKCVILD